MNTARIWKLVTAGFIAAGLLAAVPTESQALAPATGVVAVAQAPNTVVVLPAAKPGEAEAVLAMLPACTCPPNAGEVAYALKELGVKSLSLKLLVNRLGKQAGTDAFAALVLSLSKKAATLKHEDSVPGLQGQVELSDIARNNQLGETRWTPRTRDLVNDRQLEQRYKAAGIEHLFFVWAVTDPGERQRCRITRYGDRAFGKGSFPDAPEGPLGDEFDAWLAPRVRAALEGYRRLPPPSQA